MSTVLNQQAESSLYYLQLQQQIQDENRAFSTISNVLKARHDTVKTAIGNIR
jgi:ACT domain-containing protein